MTADLENLAINDLATRVREALIEVIHDVDPIPDSEAERVEQQLIKLQPLFEYFGRLDAQRGLAVRRMEIARLKADTMYKNIFLNGHAGLTLQRLCVLVHDDLQAVRDALAE